MTGSPVKSPTDRGRAAGTGSSPNGGAPARRYRVEGMDCGGCAATVEKIVGGIDGVGGASVSFATATMEVEGPAPPDAVIAAVARAGYRAAPVSRDGAGDEPAWWRDARTVSTVLALALLAVAVIASLAGAVRAVAEPLYLAAMATGGWPIARSAFAALRRRAIDMNVLMTLAAAGAVGIGHYSEGAWVLALFALGTTLESHAFDRSRRSLRDLMELTPPQATVLADDGSERSLPVGEIPPGARFIVRPGERIALDGEVLSGESAVDEAPVTGESVPVEKARGDQVFAGTLNAQGALTVRAERTAGNSTLARIAALVERAQASRAPSERFVDRFARVYTPIVLAAAVALALVPPAFGGSFDTWTYRALALLIVACPCALVISIPVAVVSAVGSAARDGVLLKDGASLERLGRVSAFGLDKTGTVTRGVHRLVEIMVPGGGDENELLALAATVERRSEHPLAEALVRAARERNLALAEPDSFEALPGRGVAATTGGRELWAGGPRLADERLARLPEAAKAMQDAGRTAIMLGEGERVLAIFGLADDPRPEAAAAVADLHSSGIGRVELITGDNERVARAVAADVGADGFRAGLLPGEKLNAIREMERKYGPVAMVGDGINDAPALAGASIGIAMGAIGSDAALESADVALMQDDLSRLPGTVSRARKAARVMRQNVIASLAVKAVFVVLAPLGMVTLILAVAADMGMSLLVTLNGLRLFRGRPAASRPGSGSPAEPAEGCCAEGRCTTAPGA